MRGLRLAGGPCARAVLRFAAVALLAGPALAQDCGSGERAFEHAAGTACIPEAPQRIVAPRGDAIATPLLELGAPVVGAGFRETDDGETYLRGASDIFGQDFVDDAGLTSVGDPNAPDMEAIAALGPDLIIIRVYQEEALAQYQAIAPTVMAPANVPFLDHIAFVADAAGVSGTYDEEIAAYEARIEEARAAIGEPRAITVSRLDIWEDGLWFYPRWGALDQVIRDIGFAMPAIQAEATENMSGVSVERIEAFDGDVLLSSTAPRFGQDLATLEALHDEVAPFWRELPGVAAGGHYWYERDLWNGNAFASLHAAIDGLELITAGRFE